MLKLKIGNNYLLTNYVGNNKTLIDKAIPYMMGCFKGEGQLAVALLPELIDSREILEAMNSSNVSTIYLLTYCDYLNLPKEMRKENIFYKKIDILSSIRPIKQANPDVNIKIIQMNTAFKSSEYMIANQLYNKLKLDKNYILSSLNILETYKQLNKRFQSIPNEIKVIDAELKKLEKPVSVCNRGIKLKDLEYLQLIDKAEIADGYLTLTLKELNIRPSEPLGIAFTPSCFNNKYLREASKYIYTGCHFKMPKTLIRIDKSFRPVFIKTLDHTFDNMFKKHNWSNIGYPHFGVDHFCPGEFNDTMAHAKEYGLDYYFISLKQYLTTANMRDCAGVKIWWYPIYNDKEELVYCAGLDILYNEIIKNSSPNLYNYLKDKTWAEKAEALKEYTFDSSIVSKFGAGGMSYSNHGPDSFIAWCKDHDKDLYAQIMKGNVNNG